MSENTFTIGFGVFHPTIRMQLKKQKLNFSIEAAKEFEELRQAIISLYFGGILTDKGYQNALQKLFNKIKRHLKIHNKHLQLPKQ